MNESVRLSPVVEGVEFRVDLLGETVRALVFAEVLRGTLNAGPKPEDWLTAYWEHRDVLHAAVVSQHNWAGRPWVFLRKADVELGLQRRKEWAAAKVRALSAA